MPVALAHADGAQHWFFPLRAFPHADTVICLWDGRPETDAKPEIAPRLLRLPIEAVQPVLSRRRWQAQAVTAVSVSAKINRRPGSLVLPLEALQPLKRVISAIATKNGRPKATDKGRELVTTQLLRA